MIIRIVQWALRQRIASRALKSTLTELADRAGSNGHVAVAQSALASAQGISERQVRHHLSGLEALGVISRVHRNKGNRGRTTDVIVLAIDQTFDIAKEDLTAGGYNVCKGRFSSGSETSKSSSLPEVPQPVALPGGNLRANKRLLTKGSAKPKTRHSNQGEKASKASAKPGDVSAPVESVPPTSELPPSGRETLRRSKGSVYARHRAMLDHARRGTVH